MKKIPAFLKNKYGIAVALFLLWMLFFDRNSFINQFRLSSELRQLKQEKVLYTQEILNDSIALNTILNNPKELERYGREKYLMKQDKEDIYLIIKD